MPLTEQELLERDAKRDIGEELLQAIRDVKAGRYGAIYEVEPGPSPTRPGAGLPPSQSGEYPPKP
jgi:putative transcriptional regulator